MSVDLALTENFAQDCENAECPWFKMQGCQLAGKVLNQMALRTERPLDIDKETEGHYATSYWVNNNQIKFTKLPESCIFIPAVRTALKGGILPQSILLRTTELAQFAKLVDWVGQNGMSGIGFHTDSRQQTLEIDYFPTASAS